jgi:hypothetical protein
MKYPEKKAQPPSHTPYPTPLIWFISQHGMFHIDQDPTESCPNWGLVSGSPEDIFLKFPLFMCAYNDWVISPPSPPHPHPFLPPPSLPSRYCSALISNFVEERV